VNVGGAIAVPAQEIEQLRHWAIEYASLGVTGPFTRVRFDFVLQDALNELESIAASRYQSTAICPGPASASEGGE
jgi:hypothetical protein